MCEWVNGAAVWVTTLCIAPLRSYQIPHYRSEQIPLDPTHTGGR